MTKASLILGTVTVALASGIAVFAAQQQQHDRGAQHHQVATHAGMSAFAGLHDGCPASGGAANTSAKSHVPEHFAQMLELTSTQLADIDRLSAELCQAITKAHESMMNVLTPQQREKVAQLHGGDHEPSGIHALMKRLHGGGR